MRIYILLILSVIFISCRTQYVEGGQWYGPAHMAIEDYTSYYYELPKSTSDLTRFIEFRVNTSPDASSIYFGDAVQLLKLLKLEKAEMVYLIDSCYFQCNFRGLKEKGVFYSPDYQIRNLKRFHNMGRDLLFTTAIFGNEGRRINYEDEVWLTDTIKNRQSILLGDFRKMGEIDFGTIRILLKFEDNVFLPLSDITRDLFESNIENENATSSVNDPRLYYSNYLNSIKCVLEQYQGSHPEVSSIVFPTILFVENIQNQ